MQGTITLKYAYHSPKPLLLGSYIKPATRSCNPYRVQRMPPPSCSNVVSSAYSVISSASVPANQRYEYWLTSQLTDFEALKPTPMQRQDFQGTVTSLVSDTSALYELHSDGFAGFRSRAQIQKNESNKLALIYMIKGQAVCTYENDTQQVIQAGQFLFFDALKPNRIQFHDPHFVEITLPRIPLLGALANNAPPSQIANALSASPLSVLLSSQLRQCNQLADQLETKQQLALLQATESLALTVVDAISPGPWTQSEVRLDGLYIAALRYIHHNLGALTIDAETIAAALGCSRATLYRAFAKHPMSVAEQIRELRLQKLARLLQTADESQSIAYLAHSCGLHDIPNLSRLFRQRFGVTARDFRAMHQAQSG